MRLLRNLIKYGIGLPVLLFVTVLTTFVYLMGFILNEEDIQKECVRFIKDIWETKE
jgi:hypothetical protein